MNNTDMFSGITTTVSAIAYDIVRKSCVGAACRTHQAAGTKSRPVARLTLEQCDTEENHAQVVRRAHVEVDHTEHQTHDESLEGLAASGHEPGAQLVPPWATCTPPRSRVRSTRSSRTEPSHRYELSAWKRLRTMSNWLLLVWRVLIVQREVVVLVESIDAVTSATIQVRHSYKAEDIMSNHRHVNYVGVGPETGGAVIDFRRSHETKPVDPECNKVTGSFY
ncbi:unnamed protein product [Phytophthora fragariaefolia]|uniref:Unnamed protein product n=1 Tax=Phytophthora fragariaefolia TaxID=1490495 RepID=A0A9W6X314_9STRA|nr:unnamed protein product [Phytophthora fragariaefolia]